MLLIVAVSLSCFEISPFGPQADALFYADFEDSPLTCGGILNGLYGVFIEAGADWSFNQFWANGLPITGLKMLNADTLMVTMGDGSFSDGLYNFDLNTHSWSVNEWFMYPNFLIYNPNNGTYYVGERDGLFRSTNAADWTRITAIGNNRCSSLAFHGTNLVTNNGTNVKYSTDNGQSWQTADTGNLRGFYYGSSGILYALMDVQSDSDGLWRSIDNGATWDCVLHTSNLNCIGPDYGDYLVLGWSEANGDGAYVALIDQQFQLTNLLHENLDSGVRQQAVFPLVNTLAFYVLNAEGCFFVTNFLPVDNSDFVVSTASRLQLSAFPNPFSGMVEIALKNAETYQPAEVEIYNLKGQRINIQRFNPSLKSSFIWDGNDERGKSLGSGIYIIKASQAGNKASCRLLKLN